jgi:hypothetical protein
MRTFPQSLASRIWRGDDILEDVFRGTLRVPGDFEQPPSDRALPPAAVPIWSDGGYMVVAWLGMDANIEAFLELDAIQPVEVACDSTQLWWYAIARYLEVIGTLDGRWISIEEQQPGLTTFAQRTGIPLEMFAPLCYDGLWPFVVSRAPFGRFLPAGLAPLVGRAAVSRLTPGPGVLTGTYRDEDYAPNATDWWKHINSYGWTMAEAQREARDNAAQMPNLQMREYLLAWAELSHRGSCY